MYKFEVLSMKKQEQEFESIKFLDEILQMIQKICFCATQLIWKCNDIMKNTDFGTFTKCEANLYFDLAMPKSIFLSIWRIRSQ
jgi:hypothetical protein